MHQFVIIGKPVESDRHPDPLEHAGGGETHPAAVQRMVAVGAVLHQKRLHAARSAFEIRNGKKGGKHGVQAEFLQRSDGMKVVPGEQT